MSQYMTYMYIYIDASVYTHMCTENIYMNRSKYIVVFLLWYGKSRRYLYLSGLPHRHFGITNIFPGLVTQPKNHMGTLSYMKLYVTLHWRHNDHDGVSNHQPHDCLLNRLFRRRSKKTSKLRVTGLCVGNSPGPVNSPHKGPVTRKMFPFDDVIMKCDDVWHYSDSRHHREINEAWQWICHLDTLTLSVMVYVDTDMSVWSNVIRYIDTRRINLNMIKIRNTHL